MKLPPRIPITVDTTAAAADLAPLARLLLALAGKPAQRREAQAAAPKPTPAGGAR